MYQLEKAFENKAHLKICCNEMLWGGCIELCMQKDINCIKLKRIEMFKIEYEQK